MFAAQKYFFQKGRVAEWLGRGLQNLVQRFKSARDLEFSLSDRSFLHEELFRFLFFR